MRCASRAWNDHRELACIRVRFVQRSDEPVRRSDETGRNVPPRRAFMIHMRASTSTSSTSTPILIAIFVFGGLAFLVTRYLQTDGEQPAVADLSVTVTTSEPAPEPLVQRFARELAPLARHTMHYEGGGALGSWHGQAREVWFTADIDFDRGELVATDPDGERHRTLTRAQADILHNLATFSCHKDWHDEHDCTDVAYRLDVVDGDCTLHVHGSCPQHEELIGALYPVAWPDL